MWLPRRARPTLTGVSARMRWEWLEVGSRPGGWKRAWASDMMFPPIPCSPLSLLHPPSLAWAPALEVL